MTKLPFYKAPTEEDNVTYFKRMCYEGMALHYGEQPPQQIRERLEYELDVIIKMGYVDYYLIVYDFIHYAKTHDIPVGGAWFRRGELMRLLHRHYRHRPDPLPFAL